MNRKLSLIRPLAYFDLETTGTSTITDRVVQIAVHKYFPDGTVEKKVKLINPEMPIPKDASAIHGITDEMVKDKPPFKCISKALLQYMTDCDFAGYNLLRFDVPMLVEEFLRAGLEHPFDDARIIDAYNIFCKKEPRTLTGAVKFYCNRVMENAHDANIDVEETANVLEAQLQHYEDLSLNIDELASFSGDDKSFIDYDRKLVRDEEGNCRFNFGKNKGKLVIDCLDYCFWMINQGNFSHDTKSKLRKLIMIKHEKSA